MYKSQSLYERLKSDHKLKLLQEIEKFPAVMSQVKKTLETTELVMDLPYEIVLAMHNYLDLNANNLYQYFDEFKSI